MKHRIVLTGVAVLGIGGAAIAAPLSVSATPSQTSDDWALQPTVRQANPWLISAEPMVKGVSLSGGFSYAELDGRKFQLKDGLLQVAPNESLMLYYDRQEYFVRGRSSGRVYLDSDVFGVRYSFSHRSPEDSSMSYAVGFEYDAPGDMSAVEPSTTAKYFATKSYHTSVLASDGKRNHYQFTYSYVDGAGDASGNGYFAGYRRELKPMGRFSADVQVYLGFQSIQYVYNTFEFRGMGQLLASYELATGLNLEAGLTVAPGGLPMMSSQLNSLSSFMVNRPSGTAGNAMNDSIGFASLRLSYLVKF